MASALGCRHDRATVARCCCRVLRLLPLCRQRFLGERRVASPSRTRRTRTVVLRGPLCGAAQDARSKPARPVGRPSAAYQSLGIGWEVRTSAAKRRSAAFDALSEPHLYITTASRQDFFRRRTRKSRHDHLSITSDQPPSGPSTAAGAPRGTTACPLAGPQPAPPAYRPTPRSAAAGPAPRASSHSRGASSARG